MQVCILLSIDTCMNLYDVWECMTVLASAHSGIKSRANIFSFTVFFFFFSNGFGAFNRFDFCKTECNFHHFEARATSFSSQAKVSVDWIYVYEFYFWDEKIRKMDLCCSSRQIARCSSCSTDQILFKIVLDDSQNLIDVWLDHFWSHETYTLIVVHHWWCSLLTQCKHVSNKISCNTQSKCVWPSCTNKLMTTKNIVIAKGNVFLSFFCIARRYKLLLRVCFAFIHLFIFFG